jgi:hypothetical protein
MDQQEGEEETYLNCNTVCKEATLNGEINITYPKEFPKIFFSWNSKSSTTSKSRSTSDAPR